ncbi:toxin-antitoxin system YwqK family antitoxin [Sulfurimonas sp. SAG-AH-194-L11]|nr:toxin-antitoxin system YwqK family antitoxin [Sulfurimonas sp. SAG-AH-194-L11]MDF1877674.1 toxin-antitoxin system YwqK family antitoxin [Sulfurimonas sp. SAG-AH-194-L11]
MNTYFKFSLLLLLSAISLNAELVTSYFEHGELKAETNYIDGTNTDIEVGIKNGIEKVYYEMGALAYSVNYVSDQRDGKLTWFDKQGHKLADMFYKDGLLEGVEQSYYKNGIIKHRVMYIHDMKEGKQEEFFDNGTLASTITYKHNKKEGMQKEYTLSGKLYTQVLYKNNYKEGTQEWYDEQGNITHSIFYKMDRPLDIMKKIKDKKEEPNVLIQSIDFSPKKAE